jgi:hypothetical protein
MAKPDDEFGAENPGTAVWRVHVSFLVGSAYLLSVSEPIVHMGEDGRIRDVTMTLLPGGGDTVGFIHWPSVVGLTWRAIKSRVAVRQLEEMLIPDGKVEGRDYDRVLSVAKWLRLSPGVVEPKFLEAAAALQKWVAMRDAEHEREALAAAKWLRAQARARPGAVDRRLVAAADIIERCAKIADDAAPVDEAPE